MRFAKGTPHRIEVIEEERSGRAHWACECGAGGDCQTEDVETNAERHLADGDVPVYRWQIA